MNAAQYNVIWNGWEEALISDEDDVAIQEVLKQYGAQKGNFSHMDRKQKHQCIYFIEQWRRKQKDISQAKVALKMGVNQSRYSEMWNRVNKLVNPAEEENRLHNDGLAKIEKEKDAAVQKILQQYGAHRDTLSRLHRTEKLQRIYAVEQWRKKQIEISQTRVANQLHMHQGSYSNLCKKAYEMIQQTEQEDTIQDEWNSDLVEVPLEGLQYLERFSKELNMDLNESPGGFAEGTADTFLFSAPNAKSVKL